MLSTDGMLSDEEIVRIYGIRWKIEQFFKVTKSYLQLAKEFQGRSYDMMISHTTIVFSRYLLLEWESRQATDPRSLGELFFWLCDEVKLLDFSSALQFLWLLFQKLVSRSVSVRQARCQVQDWIATLPFYIKACLPISPCES
ncbi:hypothetical protein B9T62_07805 [Paenibacillus donghaensis]|uniref:Transposase IS4-like domain-containing protein n=1 Tax=Paenibacillus donghaensis TaxID=414771 RepID=A0A2Z2KL79_9BACL|nr:hypothetical protein [Paenibacillus donghaensis]ASA20701.1 hypothetical protein B9T62_07805 [Paenibacillus donghaensis]